MNIPTLDDADHVPELGSGAPAAAEAPQGWTASVLTLADLDGSGGGGLASSHSAGAGVGAGGPGGGAPLTARGGMAGGLAALPTVTPEGVDLSLLKDALLAPSLVAEGEERWGFDAVLGQVMLRLGGDGADAAEEAAAGSGKARR